MKKNSLEYLKHSKPAYTPKLEAILNAPSPAKHIQNLPIPELFYHLTLTDEETKLQVMPLINQEQLTGLLDIGGWKDDRIHPKGIMAWLKPYLEIDPTKKQFYKRFQLLEEEYQIALGCGRIEMIDLETYEDLASDRQDLFNHLPGNELFYRLLTTDEKEVEFFENLIEAMFSQNVAYAYSYLAHCHSMPPNETEHQLSRFRNARLEEEGFIPYEESLLCLRPLKKSEIKIPHLEQADSNETSIISTSVSSNFLKDVFAYFYENEPKIHKDLELRFNSLGNSIAAATKVEPHEISVLHTIQQISSAYVSLALNSLCGSSLEVAAEVTKNNHPQILFRYGLHLLRESQEKFFKEARTHKFQEFLEFERLFDQQKWALLQTKIIEDLSKDLPYEQCIHIAGCLHQFPYLYAPKETTTQRYIDSSQALSTWEAGIEKIIKGIKS